MNIEHCPLFDGQPYIFEKDGKYHVLQGNMTADHVQNWCDTESEAVERWNSRVKAGIEIPICDNDVLKDRNGKVVHLGDKLSFEGTIAQVVWWEEQGRFYLDFGNNNLFELIFYTWIHDDFEIVNEKE